LFPFEFHHFPIDRAYQAKIKIKTFDLFLLFFTSALATAKIDIHASSSCKLSSANDLFPVCFGSDVVAFFGLVVFDRSNIISSDSSNVCSSNPSFQNFQELINIIIGMKYLPVIDFNRFIDVLHIGRGIIVVEYTLRVNILA